NGRRSTTGDRSCRLFCLRKSQFGYGKALTGAGSPCKSAESHAAERVVHGACCSGVAWWLCAASMRGTASFGPAIWLNAVQIPIDGATLSRKPIATIVGTRIRDAKFTTSKYGAVSMTRGFLQSQNGYPASRP